MGGDVDTGPAQRTQHDGTAGHEGGGDPAGKVPAAPRILKPVVLGIGGVIGVAGAQQVGGLGVIGAAGVLVFHHQRNSGALRRTKIARRLPRCGEWTGRRPERGVCPYRRPQRLRPPGPRRPCRPARLRWPDRGSRQKWSAKGRCQRYFSWCQSSMPSRGRSPSTGMVSARQQPRPGTLITVIWPPWAFLSCSISASTFSLL